MECIFGPAGGTRPANRGDATDNEYYVPDSRDDSAADGDNATTSVRAPPASNTYVRYLFDSQLFNVPNNYDKFKVWLTYLHSERIFEVCYVVGMTSSKVRGVGSSTSTAASGWWTEARSRGVVTTKDTSAARAASSGVTDLLPAPSAATQAMFNGSGEVALRQPINRYDVRDLVQNVRLTGAPHEWLDLKVQLCLPSILIFVKLSGSPTNVPSADHTTQIDMRELQVLRSEDTLGEKLVRILADLRARFFNAAPPDYNKLRLLTESDAYVGDEEPDAARTAVTANVVHTQQLAQEPPAKPLEPRADLPPPVPDESLLDAEQFGEAARQGLAKRRRTEYRKNIGTGVVDQVYTVSDFR